MSAVEEATAEAAKHGDRSSEPLAALVVEARVMIEQSRAEQAERARAAAEAAEAAAEEAAEKLQLEEEVAALALSVQSDLLRVRSDARRVQSDALRMQQMQARLGSSVVPPPVPNPGAEETMCVVCFDAPKDHLVLPCKHLCVCEACAEQLTKTRTPMCPVCRGPIRETMKVFCSLLWTG